MNMRPGRVTVMDAVYCVGWASVFDHFSFAQSTMESAGTSSGNTQLIAGCGYNEYHMK